MALISAMKYSSSDLPEQPGPQIYIAPLGSNAAAEAQRIVYDLRQNGVLAECDIVGRSLKSQMKYADKIGAAFTVIIGDDEIATGRAILRNMKTSEQTGIDLGSIAGILSKEGL